MVWLQFVFPEGLRSANGGDVSLGALLLSAALHAQGSTDVQGLDVRSKRVGWIFELVSSDNLTIECA